MRRFCFLLPLLAVCSSGCFLSIARDIRVHNDKVNISQGILATGQSRAMFRKLWGPPTKTYSQTFSRDGVEGQISWGRWGGGGSFTTHPGGTYDLWFYAEKEVTLVFDREETLVYWHWGPDAPNPGLLEPTPAAASNPKPSESRPSQTRPRSPAIFSGTGFVIAEGGYVLTCEHVVGKSSQIEICEGNGTKHEGKVLAIDKGNDLCLLKADDLEANPIPAAPRNSARAGETVYSLGYPLQQDLDNRNPVAGSGVIASLAGLKGDPRHLQVTLPVNPGNSGGPILDAYGRWIGVFSHKLGDLYNLQRTATVPQAINFAVKGSLAAPLFDSAPDLKLPIGEADERLQLDELAKRFSSSVVIIKASQ